MKKSNLEPRVYKTARGAERRYAVLSAQWPDRRFCIAAAGKGLYPWRWAVHCFDEKAQRWVICT
jgi:hypothetical protein